MRRQSFVLYQFGAISIGKHVFIADTVSYRVKISYAQHVALCVAFRVSVADEVLVAHRVRESDRESERESERNLFGVGEPKPVELCFVQLVCHNDGFIVVVRISNSLDKQQQESVTVSVAKRIVFYQ